MSTTVSKEIGSLYKLSKQLGTTTKDKKGIFGMFDHWYTTNYRHGKLQVRIHEWCNGMAVDDWLDRMTIWYDGKLVMDSHVHRDNAAFHQIMVSSNDPKWMECCLTLINEYDF